MPRSTFAVEFDEKKVDAVFAALDQCHLPGAAVGVAIQGQPVYRKGFGLANMELPVVLTPSIRMRVGSVTKHFTALAYLLLCEEGRAALDDPLGKFLPELHPATHAVTVRQLLGHISGLRDACNYRFQFSGIEGPRASTEELLTLYREIEDSAAAPGTTWMYSNGGYILLGTVIERLTAQPLERVMRKRIFEPIGMHDTLLRYWDTNFLPNSASPHMTNANGAFERSSWGLNFAGGGALVSTVDDLLRWMAQWDAPVVGTRASWDALRTPLKLANGVSTGYGFGLISTTYRGVETLYHPGGWLGANAQMLKVPSAQLDVIVMVNRHDVMAPALADKILDACLADLKPVKPAGPIATGTFRSPLTGRVVQLFGREGAQIASVDGYDYPMEMDEEGVLRVSGYAKFVKQSISLIGESTQPTSILFDDFGTQDNLEGVSPPEQIDLTALVGRYRSDTTQTEAEVILEGQKPRLITRNRFGQMSFEDLRCLAPNTWLARPGGGVAEWFSFIVNFGPRGAEFRSCAIGPKSLPFRRVA